MAPIPPDESPDELALLAEVHRLVHRTAGSRPVARRPRWVDGRVVFDRDGEEPQLPRVGSTEWWAAEERVRVASLLVLAASWLLADPDRQVRARLKAAAVGVSEGMQGMSVGPSFEVLEQRRAA